MTLADPGLPTRAPDPRRTAVAPARALPTASRVDPTAARAPWLRRYARSLVVVDTLVLLAVDVLAVYARYGLAPEHEEVRGVSYPVGSLLLLPFWIAVLFLSRCYETRFVGKGSEEFKRVASASFRVAALVVFVAFMTRTDVARGFLLVALPGGLCGVVGGRLAARSWLHRQRRRGACLHNVVVVGPADAALEMTMRLQRDPLAGFHVVAACVIGDPRRYAEDAQIPVLGSLRDVVPVLHEAGADTVCVAAGPGVSADELRQLTYELEGSRVDLLVSPVLTNVTGTRLSHRTLPGLPLLHVDEPELTGARRLVKAVFDRVVGLLLLIVATPLLVVIGLAVRLTSPGPALFLQERVGRAGEEFRVWKFRSMYVDAEQRREALAALNVHRDGGVLFKIYDDPRVTPLGRFLRRYSLDELPQLVNVVLGQMSLVGPRPPLRDEVQQYDRQAHRRLLVKPGMTGLWQVSGRSDLAWDESVRLDLHYVENWSLGLDVAIIFRTALAVLRPCGAY